MRVLSFLFCLFVCWNLAKSETRNGWLPKYYKLREIMNGMITPVKTIFNDITDHKKTNSDHNKIDNKNFPCPYALDIAPCNCTVLQAGLELTCKTVQSQEQLEAIFQKNFPVKNFNRFMIYDSPDLLAIGNILNGVTFEYVILQTSGISWLSDYFLLDSIDTLQGFIVRDCDLVSETFPFITLPSYNNLTQLTIDGNLFTWIPVIQSDSIELLSFTDENIAVIETGTFDELTAIKEISLLNNNISTLFSSTFSDKLTQVERIDLSQNKIVNLVPGTFHLPAGPVEINLRINNIADISPGAFVMPNDTVAVKFSLLLDFNDMTEIRQDVFGSLWPYFETFSMANNPLNCGCDVGWLVLDPPLIDTLSNTTRCNDGRSLYELDPAYYETFC